MQANIRSSEMHFIDHMTTSVHVYNEYRDVLVSHVLNEAEKHKKRYAMQLIDMGPRIAQLEAQANEQAEILESLDHHERQLAL